eukprot:3832398-Amphidinium_carterae.1
MSGTVLMTSRPQLQCGTVQPSGGDRGAIALKRVGMQGRPTKEGYSYPNTSTKYRILMDAVCGSGFPSQ